MPFDKENRAVVKSRKNCALKNNKMIAGKDKIQTKIRDFW